MRVKEPMVLGHEISGTLEAVGAQVAGFAPGDRVAISPGRPCGRCRYCRLGLQIHCLDMRYYGSAMRTPHELLNKGLVGVKPLISSALSYRDAGRAFALAADRSQAMKVLLDFE